MNEHGTSEVKLRMRLWNIVLGARNLSALVARQWMVLKRWNRMIQTGGLTRSSDMRAIGESFGRSLHSRYLVIALNMYVPLGHFIPDDPQRRLDIRKRNCLML
ncbi:hypothetical protein Leryth_011822 [Lithospermum erythrorhizon]|nr:hypothetical protein Leryth_011822 [Lithospermum erythrorhizon]